MLKQLNFLKTKIAAGYILLIAVLLFSVYFIYRETELLSAPDKYEQELNQKRKAINNTLALLYQTETVGQSLSAGQLKDYPLYRKAMREALVSVDSLKKFASDSLQNSRMDSLSVLLEQKEMNIISLLKTMSDSEADKLYKQNIERIIKEHDSLLTQPQVKKKSVIRKNSYLTKEKRKGFFKRLANVFAPSEKDSSLIVNTSHEIITDTLLQTYNQGDSIAGIFKNIQVKISEEQQQMRELVRNKNNILRQNNQILNQKINQLIRNFEEEELNSSLTKLESQQEIKQQSMRIIGGIAAGAVLLAIIFLIVVWRDITKSNHYRKELEVAKKRAEDLLVSREKLMLTITHDFKAPLSSIMGYTELLTRLTAEERQRFYLNNMKSSSEHLLRLVNDLLDFYRLESNKIDVNRIAFNPKQLFDEIIISFVPVAEKKGLELTGNIEKTANGYFTGDPLLMKQIANNLISNAIKFTQKGEVNIAVSLERNMLRLEVSDTGMGIAEEDLKKIFQEFTRLQGAQGAEGFGLGLSITQKLVNLLGGDINIHSKYGEGTTFLITLPLETVTENLEKTNTDRTVNIEAIRKDIRCLLIDDDRIQLELTASMLKQQHILSVCCHEPETVLDLLTKESFTLILTDVQMPALNGFELLRQLRSSGISQAEALPVIAVTARSDMDEANFVDKGFAGCLHKPFSINELITKINKVLARFPEIKIQGSENSPHLHFEALTAFSEDDPEAAAEIMHTFIVETGKNKELLRQALEESNTKDIAAISHKLLPLFSLINASVCIEPLIWLEKQKEKPVSEEIKEKVRLILEEIDKIIEEVKKQ